MLQAVRNALLEHADPVHQETVKRFFKSGPGEYGEGDRFIGVRVPVIRRIARQHRDLGLGDTKKLLGSPFHEERLLALVILIEKYRKGSPQEQEKIHRLYLDHTRFVNNWDLVDASAEHLVGAHLHNKDRAMLHTLARSQSIWERRIAVMATFHYIKQKEYDEALKIAERLVMDPEPLVQKAVGWMLREIGNRDRAAEEAFLKRHHKRMPRTMLRYAIERFPEDLRQAYLKNTIA